MRRSRFGIRADNDPEKPAEFRHASFVSVDAYLHSTSWRAPVPLRVGQLFRRDAGGAKRVHTSGGQSREGTSLAAETGECASEESRLKAGCSQDWLPHKARMPQTE